MRIYGWELYELCHYADKSCDHKHYDGGDIIFLICHVNSGKQILGYGLCEFMGGSPPR